MNQSDSKRFLYLGGVALLLLAILIIRWIHGWGLVTIHVKDAPISKVIASISMQGHVRVESSLDPMQLVSIDVDKVLPAVAVDILSIRADASWRVVYLAAPTRAVLNEAIIHLSKAGKIDDWATHYYPTLPLETENGQVLDPRYLELKIDGPENGLFKLLDQAAQKSGVMTASPQNWLPSVQKLPQANQVRRVLTTLIKSAHGKSAEFFLITHLPQRRAGNESVTNDSSQSQPSEAGPRFGDFASMNPAWREEKQLAQIKLLPLSEQDAARKKLAERQALFDQLKGLSPEERRAKWQQMMSNPDNLQQMQDRQLLRQANQTSAQRINRAVNYLTRKASAQGH